MHPACLRCAATFCQESAAYICSFECTFCDGCAEDLKQHCPNCGGDLQRRPTRTLRTAQPMSRGPIDAIDAANLSDLPQLAILFDSYRQFYGKPRDVVAAHDFLAQRVRNQDSQILVARQDGSIAGFTQLFRIFSSVSMRRAWLLNDLYVLQSARGRGIAARLLSAAVAHGRDSGAAWLMLQTGQDNEIAQRLYDRNGWQRDDAFLTYHYSL